MASAMNANREMEDAALEFEMQLRRGATNDELLQTAGVLRRAATERAGELKAATNLIQFGYITGQTIREYPFLMSRLGAPSPSIVALENSDAA